MALIKLDDGSDAFIAKTNILMVTASYQQPAYSLVYGLAPVGPIIAAVDAPSLIAQLGLSLAKLTRASGQPVWILASQVAMIRKPRSHEMGNAVISIQGVFNESVQESVQAAQNLLQIP